MKSEPSAPAASDAAVRVAIVASRYNATFTDALCQHCQQELEQLLPQAAIQVSRVPGAFEIPVVVEALCRLPAERRPQAVVALGVIIRGSTAHADLIAEAITQGLQSSARTHLIPVIHEVLLVDDAGQAEARTQGLELNRGQEAGRAAAEMIQAMEELEG